MGIDLNFEIIGKQRLEITVQSGDKQIPKENFGFCV